MRRSEDERTSPATRESERRGTMGRRQTRNAHRSTPEGETETTWGPPPKWPDPRQPVIGPARWSTLQCACRTLAELAAVDRIGVKYEVFRPLQRFCHRGWRAGRGESPNAVRPVFLQPMPRPRAVADSLFQPRETSASKAATAFPRLSGSRNGAWHPRRLTVTERPGCVGPFCWPAVETIRDESATTVGVGVFVRCRPCPRQPYGQRRADSRCQDLWTTSECGRTRPVSRTSKRRR